MALTALSMNGILAQTNLEEINDKCYQAYLQTDLGLWQESVDDYNSLVSVRPADDILLYQMTLAQLGLLNATMATKDEDAFDQANSFLIEREDARKHLSFGYGIHRCLGNRLGEMQLRIIWEEILKRFPTVEVVGEPTYLKSSFIHGIVDLPVKIPG